MTTSLAFKKTKLYVYGVEGRGGTIRFICTGAWLDRPHEPEREAREIIEHLEKFLPRDTFDALLEQLK